jgi:hypothetical protein
LLTEDGIYAARDKLGRTPVIIGKKDGALAASSETCAFPNLGYEIEKYLGPGEIVRMTAEGCEQRKEPQDNVQILFDSGAAEVHMRPACPTLIYPCDFLNFSTSRSTLDLAGRSAIEELEGPDCESLEAYATADSEQNTAMVEKIRRRLKLTYPFLMKLMKSTLNFMKFHTRG